MPDLMGATNPVPGYDAGSNNRIPVSPGQNTNPQIQNVADPSRVSRADGKTERQDSSLQQDGRVRYDSNFQTFLQQLRAISTDFQDTLLQTIRADLDQLMGQMAEKEKEIARLTAYQTKLGEVRRLLEVDR